eukprot:scaffold22842_cov65-Phaeocystis_antarctica.AAC.9
MTDASLHLPAAFLHEAFSDRSGVPPSHFELYYRGKRLEGEAALSSYGIGKDATIEVKMRGRGGMINIQSADGAGADASGALDHAEQAAVKIQALMRGNLARDKYKDTRDEEARRQWLKYYVLTGNYAEARKLGWVPLAHDVEGEAALASYGIGKDATIEVKMRGRGGMGDRKGEQPQVPEEQPPSRSKHHVEKKLCDAQNAGVEETNATKEAGEGGGVVDGVEGGGGRFGGTGARRVVEAATSSIHQTTSDAVVPPAHDVDLSKLLSKLLRHKAVELGVAIDADGWVALSDALAQINGVRLRELVGNAEKLGSHEYTEAHVREYTEADVRDVVDANDKRRFVINGTEIRAAQGHDMPGVGEKQGKPLTLETAPEVAVHGSYVEHVQAILEQGLSRMGRHHVHLAKGLLGDTGVVSGMRSNTELFIWVKVHEAIKDGLTFYESANGVILCSGQDGNGIIPPAYFSIVIELHGGLSLETAQASLAHRLYSTQQAMTRQSET